MIENRVEQIRTPETNREQESPKEQALAEQAKRSERRDVVVKDAQRAQKNIKNIVLHTQQVLSAVQAIRAALSLGDAPIPSLQIDEKRMAELKKKVQEYAPEILSMKDEFVLSEKERLRLSGMVTEEEIQYKAIQQVEELFRELGIE